MLDQCLYPVPTLNAATFMRAFHRLCAHVRVCVCVCPCVAQWTPNLLQALATSKPSLTHLDICKITTTDELSDELLGAFIKVSESFYTW